MMDMTAANGAAATMTTAGGAVAKAGRVERAAKALVSPARDLANPARDLANPARDQASPARVGPGGAVNLVITIGATAAMDGVTTASASLAREEEPKKYGVPIFARRLSRGSNASS